MISDVAYDAAEIVKMLRPDFTPRIALILGSGLGMLADQIVDTTVIKFEELAGFPVSTVKGHAGELVLGFLNGVPVACMKGRGHYYEGFGMDVMTNAVRTLKVLGCELLLVTNAAGSLRTDVDVGSMVCISDHINMLPGNPLVGPNDARFGPRFFSMANAYDKDLRILLQHTASTNGVNLHTGIFLACTGPNFETPAEVNMMARMGAHTVGMSVVPEVITARHCGMKVVGISMITNLAEGLSLTTLSHEHTIKAGEHNATAMATLIYNFIERYAQLEPVALREELDK